MATSLSFLFVFVLMAAYYILRPVRDAMASDWSDVQVSWLWTINFFASTALVAIYGWIVSRIQLRLVVPAVYTFFSLSFFAFYFSLWSGVTADWVDQAFYVWVSVFALFHVSVFWSFMAETFSQNQAARLFSVIAAGASLGAIIGPLLSAALVQVLKPQSMMLVCAAMILIPLPISAKLYVLRDTALENDNLSPVSPESTIGGNPLHGFAEFVTNPYLLGIGMFIILYTGIGSFVYLEQKNLLATYSRADRATIYGIRDAVTNTITFALAFFVTGRLVPRLGMSVALVIVPTLIFLGMLILAVSPVLTIALALWIARSAGNYGLVRPCREMLFTRVDRESRFKTKPVIDIVAYRGGDVIMAWFFSGLTQGLGLGMGGVGLVGAGLAVLWGFVGYLLGRNFRDRSIA
jgi:AAA family ATP:ADP antiporter